MRAMASQITSLTIVCSIVYLGADQRKHQSSASLAFVRGIHRWPVNSPNKGPVTRKMFPFDDVIMNLERSICNLYASSLIFGGISPRGAGVQVMWWSRLNPIFTLGVPYLHVHCYPLWATDLGFLKIGNFGFAIAHLLDYFCPWTFF